MKLLSRLLEYCEHPSPVIFLDALDECPKEHRLLILRNLLSILEESKYPIKVFISSRHCLEIEGRLKNSLNISIEAKDNAQDIENYMKSELSSKIKNGELLQGNVSMKLTRHIEEVLLRDANGM